MQLVPNKLALTSYAKILCIVNELCWIIIWDNLLLYILIESYFSAVRLLLKRFSEILQSMNFLVLFKGLKCLFKRLHQDVF